MYRKARRVRWSSKEAERVLVAEKVLKALGMFGIFRRPGRFRK